MGGFAPHAPLLASAFARSASARPRQSLWRRRALARRFVASLRSRGSLAAARSLASLGFAPPHTLNSLPPSRAARRRDLARAFGGGGHSLGASSPRSVPPSRQLRRGPPEGRCYHRREGGREASLAAIDEAYDCEMRTLLLVALSGLLLQSAPRPDLSGTWKRAEGAVASDEIRIEQSATEAHIHKAGFPRAVYRFAGAETSLVHQPPIPPDSIVTRRFMAEWAKDRLVVTVTEETTTRCCPPADAPASGCVLRQSWSSPQSCHAATSVSRR
jgi:hypothetical protein